MPFMKKKAPEPVKAVPLAGILHPLQIELLAIGPLAKQIVKVLATHGGEMEHMSIVKRLPPAPDRDLAEAFGQLRVSHLVHDTWPTYQQPLHTWKVSPYFLEAVQANLPVLG